MKTKDVMTTVVVSLDPEMRIDAIAKLFLDKQISGAPVVDENNVVIGIVSEGDLMRRLESGDEPNRSWWLRLVASAEERALDYVKVHGTHARDIMTRRVLTVDEDAPLGRVARLLEENRIKRAPVVSDGKLVGIVSRANLLRGLAVRQEDGLAAPTPNDRDLRRQVLDVLSSEGWLTHGVVNVIVENRIVQLWGFVDSEAERQAMIVATESVEGVGGIEDHLGYVAPYLRAD
ncbi:MAG: CBS domain-containing protein [Alphaproteobacteria bacterium]|nr:CBS domain-containing protein [Alphaproteobacteria bacterium]